MAFGIAKFWGDKIKAWEKSIGTPLQATVHAKCGGCYRSSIRYRKIKKGKQRMIVCNYCGHVSQSWTVGGPVPTPSGV